MSGQAECSVAIHMAASDAGVAPEYVALVLTSMVLKGALLYIFGHWDLRPGKRWPRKITEDDLKAVMGANLNPIARVSLNLNPHSHCHDI